MDRHGQVFITDFIVSIVFFTAAALAVVSAWNYMYSSSVESNTQETLSASSGNALDSLLLTGGMPSNWSETGDPRAVGLGRERIVELGNLLGLLDEGAENVSTLLGIGNYGFNLTFSRFTDTVLTGVAVPPVGYFAVDERGGAKLLNGSGSAWDYYWGQGALPAPSYGDARFSYSASPAAALGWLLANGSNYSTIVLEAPGLEWNDVNVSQLVDFLYHGGVLVYVSGGDSKVLVEKNFSVSFGRASPSRSGVVVRRGGLLRRTWAGDAVSVPHPSWAVYAGSVSPNDYAYSSSSPAGGVVSEWAFGRGRIYFFSSFNATFGPAPASDVQNVVGWPATLGSVPPAGKSTYVYSSPAVLRKALGQAVSAKLVVWIG